MLRFIKRNAKKALAGSVLFGSAVANAAEAQVYGQPVNVSTTEVLAIAGVVIAGSLVIWGIRKSVALSNKS